MLGAEPIKQFEMKTATNFGKSVFGWILDTAIFVWLFVLTLTVFDKKYLL